MSGQARRALSVDGVLLFFTATEWKIIHFVVISIYHGRRVGFLAQIRLQQTNTRTALPFVFVVSRRCVHVITTPFSRKAEVHNIILYSCERTCCCYALRVVTLVSNRYTTIARQRTACVNFWFFFFFVSVAACLENRNPVSRLSSDGAGRGRSIWRNRLSEGRFFSRSPDDVAVAPELTAITTTLRSGCCCCCCADDAKRTAFRLRPRCAIYRVGFITSQVNKTRSFS